MVQKISTTLEKLAQILRCSRFIYLDETAVCYDLEANGDYYWACKDNTMCLVRSLTSTNTDIDLIQIQNKIHRTVKLIRYVDSRDYFVMACEFIYMIFVAYYIVEEVKI